MVRAGRQVRGHGGRDRVRVPVGDERPDELVGDRGDLLLRKAESGDGSGVPGPAK